MITPNEGRTCKCGAPTLMNCPHCIECNNKRLWGDLYHEMVGRHIEQADREAAAKETLPFDGNVHDDDYASPEMYQTQDEQLGKASGL
jgi:hypothetical protein